VLTELYTAYAPKKLNDIPTLLEAYAGQEDELIASARLKYAKADQVYKKNGLGNKAPAVAVVAAAAAAAAMAAAVAARAARWAQPWRTLYRAAVTARAWWMARLGGSRPRRGVVVQSACDYKTADPLSTKELLKPPRVGIWRLCVQLALTARQKSAARLDAWCKLMR
jgi:hypothetical protein